MWFKSKKSEPAQGSSIEDRVYERTDVSNARPPMTAKIEGAQFVVLDISDGGFKIKADADHAPDGGIADLYDESGLLRSGYALRCWGKGHEVGYLLDQSVSIRRYTEHVGAHTPRKRFGSKPSAPASGNRISSLRSRLGLRDD